jgi:hypothetical protein
MDRLGSAHDYERGDATMDDHDAIKDAVFDYFEGYKAKDQTRT